MAGRVTGFFDQFRARLFGGTHKVSFSETSNHYVRLFEGIDPTELTRDDRDSAVNDLNYFLNDSKIEDYHKQKFMLNLARVAYYNSKPDRRFLQESLREFGESCEKLYNTSTNRYKPSAHTLFTKSCGLTLHRFYGWRKTELPQTLLRVFVEHNKLLQDLSNNQDDTFRFSLNGNNENYVNDINTILKFIQDDAKKKNLVINLNDDSQGKKTHQNILPDVTAPTTPTTTPTPSRSSSFSEYEKVVEQQVAPQVAPQVEEQVAPQVEEQVEQQVVAPQVVEQQVVEQQVEQPVSNTCENLRKQIEKYLPTDGNNNVSIRYINLTTPNDIDTYSKTQISTLTDLLEKLCMKIPDYKKLMRHEEDGSLSYDEYNGLASTVANICKLIGKLLNNENISDENKLTLMVIYYPMLLMTHKRDESATDQNGVSLRAKYTSYRNESLQEMENLLEKVLATGKNVNKQGKMLYKIAVIFSNLTLFYTETVESFAYKYHHQHDHFTDKIELKDHSLYFRVDVAAEFLKTIKKRIQDELNEITQKLREVNNNIDEADGITSTFLRFIGSDEENQSLQELLASKDNLEERSLLLQQQIEGIDESINAINNSQKFIHTINRIKGSISS